MDKILYMIMNTGSVEYIFDTEEERDKKYKECIDNESQYTVTHYYYYKNDMALGEYVCEYLCKHHDIKLDQAYKEAKSHDEIEEILCRKMQWDCRDCPFKKYSRFIERGDK